MTLNTKSQSNHDASEMILAKLDNHEKYDIPTPYVLCNYGALPPHMLRDCRIVWVCTTDNCVVQMDVGAIGTPNQYKLLNDDGMKEYTWNKLKATVVLD